MAFPQNVGSRVAATQCVALRTLERHPADTRGKLCRVRTEAHSCTCLCVCVEVRGERERGAQTGGQEQRGRDDRGSTWLAPQWH